MKCLECGKELKRIAVSVDGAKKKAISYQCQSCDYFTFDQKSAREVVDELRETPLKIKQKVVKLSKDRLGMYLNSNIVRSLNIKKGEEVYVSVPD